MNRHFDAVELATLALDGFVETAVRRGALHGCTHGRVAPQTCTLEAEVIAREELGAVADKLALPVGTLQARLYSHKREDFTGVCMCSLKML